MLRRRAGVRPVFLAAVPRFVAVRPRPVFARPSFGAVPRPVFRFAPPARPVFFAVVVRPVFFAAVRRFVVPSFVVGVSFMLTNLLSFVLSHFSGNIVDYVVAALLTLGARSLGSKGYLTLQRVRALNSVVHFAAEQMTKYAKSTAAGWDDLVAQGLRAADTKLDELELELTEVERAKLDAQVKEKAAEVVVAVSPHPVPALEPSPVELRVIDTKTEGE